MDPFEEFDNANKNENALFDNDPAAEFLQREQAELDKIENAGFDDILNSGSTTENAVEENENNLFETQTQNQDSYSAISSADKIAKEPETIRKWREEQRIRITTKDAEEEQKKKEWKEIAKKELEDWYKNRQEQLVKTLENNKIAEVELTAARNAQDYTGQDWDHVAKLCEFNPKANKNNKDVSRMRSILLQLKQTPLAR